jgi:PTH1 family peptidyl-tRNA hydrolase
MLLVVGLGNPGERYARTRHNVAWRVFDELISRHGGGAPAGEETYRARLVPIANREVWLLQPLTYMNLSGGALAAWRLQNGSEHEFLVVTDDIHLPLGLLRVRTRGSSGGHRGLESIEASVGSQDYDRLRVGVGAPIRRVGAADSSAELREHVLEEFAPEELPALEEAVRRSADAVECWVAEGALGAMNQFNRRLRQEESET